MKTRTKDMNMMGCTAMMNQCSFLIDDIKSAARSAGMEDMVPEMEKARRMMEQSSYALEDIALMKAGMDLMMNCMAKMSAAMMEMMNMVMSDCMADQSEMQQAVKNMCASMNLMDCMVMMQKITAMKMQMNEMMMANASGKKCMEVMNCCMMLGQCMMMMSCVHTNMKEDMMVPVITDMEMATMGMNEIRLAEMEMPGLIALKNEYSKMKPLKGMQIASCMHITVQTAVMMSAMVTMGAEVRCCASGVNSTNDSVAAAMNMMMGIPVFGRKGMSVAEMGMCMEMCLFTDEKMNCPVNMMMDMGGLMSRMMFEKYPEQLDKIQGICMDSIMGMQMVNKIFQEGKLPMPVMNLNTSPRKAKIDYKYGSMESLVSSIRNLTGMMIAGKVCVVAGYGDMGKACADAMKMAGARVIVTEIDPFCALQACMDGCMVMKMDDACRLADIIVTATETRDVIIEKHFRMMKNNCMVCNMSDYDSEIDMIWLNEVCGNTRMTMKPMVDMYRLDNKNIIVLGEGKAVNMATSTGYSSFVMSACFTIQLMGVMEFWLNSKMYDKKIYKMPVGLGVKAAKMHLSQLGIELDTLTPAQEACIREVQMFMPDTVV
jgi:adenosylhomocysteinase